MGGATVIGLSAIPQGAQAQAAITLEDHTVTLGPDETITAIAVTGTGEGSYTVEDQEVTSVRMSMYAERKIEGNIPEGDSVGYEYDDVDPNSDSFSETASIPLFEGASGFDEKPDPAPGESVTYDVAAGISLFIRGADGRVLRDSNGDRIQTSQGDRATLTVERESTDGNGGGGGNPGNGSSPSVSVTGSFAFDVTTA